MTTDFKLEYVPAKDWLPFGSMGREDSAVLSIVVHRRVDQSVETAASEACAPLIPALEEVLGSSHSTVEFLMLGRESPVVGKVDALLQSRNALWASVEGRGLALPAGQRTERNVTSTPARNRYFGGIRLELSELPLALNITRSNDAVCIVSRSSNDFDELAAAIELEMGDVSRERDWLLMFMIRRLRPNDLAIRTFGEFDDVEVAVQIFGTDDVLKGISSRLTKE